MGGLGEGEGEEVLRFFPRDDQFTVFHGEGQNAGERSVSRALRDGRERVGQRLRVNRKRFLGHPGEKVARDREERIYELGRDGRLAGCNRKFTVRHAYHGRAVQYGENGLDGRNRKDDAGSDCGRRGRLLAVVNPPPIGRSGTDGPVEEFEEHAVKVGAIGVFGCGR